MDKYRICTFCARIFLSGGGCLCLGRVVEGACPYEIAVDFCVAVGVVYAWERTVEDACPYKSSVIVCLSADKRTQQTPNLIKKIRNLKSVHHASRCRL